MNKNRTINYFRLPALTGLVLLVVSFFGCNKPNAPDCIKSTGNIERDERELGYFHSIQLNDNINLQLIQSDKHKAVVEAGKNLMPKITTELTADSVLVISNNNTCNWVRSYDKPINVYIEFEDIYYLEYRSIGDVTNLDTLRLDSLTIEVWEGAGLIELNLVTDRCQSKLQYGTADIKLKGRTGLSFVYSAGMGLIDNRDFEAEFLYTNNRSSNDVYIRSSKVIGATIENIGNIYYYGSPYEVALSRTGSGNLIKID